MDIMANVQTIWVSKVQTEHVRREQGLEIINGVLTS